MSESLSFALLKVSHSTDPPDAKKWAWANETRDVRLVFDNYGSRISHQAAFPILTVLQGASIMDRIDISLKVRDAEDVVNQARQAGIFLKPDDIPTNVVHKRVNCAIAIRYPLSETKVRRLQLKFESVHDFDRALTLLQDLGCYTRGHEARPHNDSANPSEWPSSRPSSSAFEVPGFQRQSTTTALDREQTQHRPLYSNHFRPASATPQPFSSTSQRQRSSTSTLPSQFNDNYRPSTPLFPIHEDESLYNGPVMQKTGSFDSRSHQIDPLRRRATAADPQNICNSRGESLPRADTVSNASSHGLSFLPASSNSVRPSTTSKITVAQLDDDLSSMIPPRRELPFKRPGSRQSIVSRENSNSRPTSSVDLPTLPRPSFIHVPPIESAIPSNKMMTVPSKTIVDTIEQRVNDRPQSKDITKIIANPATAIPKKPSTATGMQTKRARSTKATSTKASCRPSTALSTSSTYKQFTSTPITSDIVLGNASNATNVLGSDLRNAFGQVNSAMTVAAPQVVYTGPEKENLAHYAEMSYEERMAVIEKLIVDGVTDDNFATLCEDVFGCWQRIGFGR